MENRKEHDAASPIDLCNLAGLVNEAWRVSFGTSRQALLESASADGLKAKWRRENLRRLVVSLIPRYAGKLRRLVMREAGPMR